MNDWFNNTCIELLTCADFDNKEPWKLKNKRCAFVLFYADWCGHCQNLKPEYIKFADIAQFIKVYAVNSDSQSELLEKLKSKGPVQIQGFPTIWLYVDGEPFKEYSGARTWQELLKEAFELCNSKCKCDIEKVKKAKLKL